MKLKRLILQGFKSFKDRTSVNFDTGITGIVGPNGCGKSNIVDALFWVMGEQSAKHLRGNSMKDLIFSGSSKYSPGSFAEVSLILENNNNKHIHIGNKVCSPSEIQLTRKLYRNGETEYRINDEPARLRDIQEVFMDTGAGAKSYSIIAQGEINRLVAAKPQERRTMIEEVAGITKFKLRKRESMRKIEQTQSNLNRLQDLQTEIEKNLKVLQAQAEKASKARNLKEKIERNDLIINSHKIFDFLKTYSESKEFIDTNRTEVENWSAEKDKLELNLEQERIQKTDLSDVLNTKQEEFNEVSKELAAAEERLAYLKKSVLDKEALIERAKQENLDLEQEREEIEVKLRKLEAEQLELEEGREEDFDFEALEEQLENLKERVSDIEQEKIELEKNVTEQRNVLNQKENEVFKIQSRSEEFARNLEDIGFEIEELEKQYGGVNEDLAGKKQKLEDLEVQYEDRSSGAESLKANVDELQTKVKETERWLKEHSKKVISIESKLDSLKELRDSMEGASAGAKNFLESEQGQHQDILGNLVKCPEQYAKAVNSVLSGLLEQVLIDTNDIGNILDWFEANPDTICSSVSAVGMNENYSDLVERLEVNGCEGVLHLPDVIEWNCSDKEQKFKKIFNGHFIVQNLTAELLRSLPKELNLNGIVSSDGSLMLKRLGNTVQISQLGHGSDVNNALWRNKQIEQLETELEESLSLLKEKESESESLGLELEGQMDALEEAQSAAFELKSQIVEIRTEVESKAKNYDSSLSRIEYLKNRKSELSKNRLEYFEKDEAISIEIEELKTSIDDKALELEEIQTNFLDLKEQLEQVKDEYSEKKVFVDSFEARKKAIENQVQDTGYQLEKMDSRKEKNNELLEKMNEEVESIRQSEDDLAEQNMQTAESLADTESDLSDLKDKLSELLLEMQDRENRVKDLGKKINAAEKTMVEKEMKMQQIYEEEEQVSRNIFEKYRVDLRKCICDYLELNEDFLLELKDLSSMYIQETENGPSQIYPVSYQFVRKYPAELKTCKERFRSANSELNRLGQINWQAVEDYERQKIRFNFLREQEVELKASLDDLTEAIAHIDQKSRVRFKEAFNEVNMRFEKVFPIIFGGGAAKLEVVGDLNEPECGINIMAQPPGKKNQSINLLSGGEKALTALSLIFSIFLVKPSPFCLLDEVDAPLDDANVGRFNELLREMSEDSQFVLITHNKKTMELNDVLYGVTMQEPGVSKAVSVQLH